MFLVIAVGPEREGASEADQIFAQAERRSGDRQSAMSIAMHAILMNSHAVGLGFRSMKAGDGVLFPQGRLRWEEEVGGGSRIGSRNLVSIMRQ